MEASVDHGLTKENKKNPKPGQHPLSPIGGRKRKVSTSNFLKIAKRIKKKRGEGNDIVKMSPTTGGQNGQTRPQGEQPVEPKATGDRKDPAPTVLCFVKEEHI